MFWGCKLINVIEQKSAARRPLFCGPKSACRQKQGQPTKRALAKQRSPSSVYLFSTFNYANDYHK